MIDNIKKIAAKKLADTADLLYEKVAYLQNRYIKNFNWNDKRSSLVATFVFLKRFNKNSYHLVNRSSNIGSAKKSNYKRI